MKKDYPFFKWFPSDALGDEHYSGFTLAERGLFHLCLDYAWINDGLPEDPEAVRRLLRIDRREFAKIWPAVEPEFPKVDGRRRNGRQESERAECKTRSAKASESVKARYERTTKGAIRASDICMSDSDFSKRESAEREKQMPPAEDFATARDEVAFIRAGGVLLPRPAPKPVPIGPAPGTARLTEWLAPWPRCPNPNAVAQAWLSVVETAEDEAGAFAARDRYLASDEVGRQVIADPARWLYDQGRAKWLGKWPPRAAPAERPRQLTAMERVKAKYEAKRNGTNGIDN